MKTHKLLESETVLEDSYPIVPEYVYICDGRFMKYPGWSEITVAEWKRAGNWKEVRRCDLFGHESARLGDRVSLDGEDWVGTEREEHEDEERHLKRRS